MNKLLSLTLYRDIDPMQATNPCGVYNYAFISGVSPIGETIRTPRRSNYSPRNDAERIDSSHSTDECNVFPKPRCGFRYDKNLDAGVEKAETPMNSGLVMVSRCFMHGQSGAPTRGSIIYLRQELILLC